MEYVALSAVDCEGRSAEPHRHAYIRLKNNRTRSWFHPELRDKCYLRIVQAKGGRSFDESVRRYVNYIKAKGKIKQALKAQGKILQNLKHVKLPYMKEVCSCFKHQLNHQLKSNYTCQF